MIDTGRCGRELPSREHQWRRHFRSDCRRVLPRFVASNNPQTVIQVSPCTTTLLFPFVTGKDGYTTGLAITNTSEQEGSCTASSTGTMLLMIWIRQSRVGASVGLHDGDGLPGLPHCRPVRLSGMGKASPLSPILRWGRMVISRSARTCRIASKKATVQQLRA